LVAPKRPECLPLARDVGDGKARLVQQALPKVDLVDLATDRQAIHGCVARLRVAPRHPGERVRIEQAREGSDYLREIGQPVGIGPGADVVLQQDTKDEVGRISRLERCYNLVRELTFCGLVEFDLLPALLLESADDLP
jgi:hypothetical protein